MNKSVIAWVLSIILILAVAGVIIYYSVPAVNTWVNSLFNTTEQPSIDSEPTKPAPPEGITYEVTSSSVTFTGPEGVEYSINGVDWQDDSTFNNLDYGTNYKFFARFKATGINYASDVVAIDVTTLKGSQNAPTGLTYTSTSSTITISTVTGGEFSLNNIDWQESRRFISLESNTEYTIYVRYAETDRLYASPVTEITAWTLKKTEHSTPSLIIDSVTANRIIVRDVSVIQDAEYSLNGTTWQDSSVFENLTPNTQYTVYCRYKETDDYEPSDVVSTTITTLASNNSGLFTNEGEQLYTWERLISNGLVDVQDGVVTAGSNNDLLEGNLVIDSTISQIGPRAFYRTNITSVTIPASVTAIDDSAFAYCFNLTDVVLDSNSQLRTIGDNAFANSSLIYEIDLPNTVTSIGNYAFQGSTISTFNIPANCTSLGTSFVSNYSLVSITVSEGNTAYKSIDGVLFNYAGTELLMYPEASTVTNYSIPNGVEVISSGFGRNIEVLTIPSSVRELGTGVFNSATSLTTINVDSANEYFKVVDGVLYNYAGTELIAVPRGGNITNLVIPEGVLSVADSMLANHFNLETVSIPASLVDLGLYNPTFRGCMNLTAINVAEGNTVYKSVDGVLYSADMTTLYCYPIAKADSEFYVPETVTSIVHLDVLYYGTNLTALVFQTLTPPSPPITTMIPDDSDLVIYVPDSAIDTYKSTDWFNLYLDRIKPISEKTS